MDGSPRCDGKRDLAAIISQLAICTYPAVLQRKVHLELPRVAKLLQYQKQSDLYKNPGQLEKQHHLTQFVVTKTLHIARPHVQPELGRLPASKFISWISALTMSVTSDLRFT